jgi:hypothetical protein
MLLLGKEMEWRAQVCEVKPCGRDPWYGRVSVVSEMPRKKCRGIKEVYPPLEDAMVSTTKQSR